MKIVALFLLLAGWIIALAAVAMMHSTAQRGVFALAGAGVEALGIGLLVRAHMPHHEERR